METMRPSAIVRLENYESKIYEKVRCYFEKLNIMLDFDLLMLMATKA